MSKKIIKIIKYIWPIVAFCLFLFLFFNVVQAQDSLGTGWDEYIKGVLPDFTTPTDATGEDIAASVIRRGISLLKYLIGGVALIFGLIYAMNFIFARGNEETISKYKKNFLWLVVGFLIIMVAENISNIFNPEVAKSEQLIDFAAGRDQLRDIANYLKWLFGSVIMLLITISGIRLITAGGKQETIDKEKQHLIWSAIGMLVILLATNIVNAIYVIQSPEVIIAADSTVAVTEVGSIIRLLLVFLGPIAILFTILAGFMYLTALDNEERASKAKRMIIGGVTGIVIIYISYALVNTFMTAQLTPPGI